MGQIVRLDKTGDTKVTWSAGNAAEVAAARGVFEDLQAKGFLAYAVSPGGNRGERITEFDPDAERIIMAPRVAGGR